ncbi:uncharacterized protein LOC132749652 [Ruditapes philippinarum]|uniref:uncharacterized protein LOC132749652 n=1 Tax=Ruditapes philippinarum TaxID=129788 RepID=UPI00295B82F6|nr:uncharacterized protein LOC132749652 [Ruditapes philippinarum]
MNLGSKCKRGKCWYRDELLQRYSQDGVTTIARENGDIICQSNHLTAFTAESEPEPFKGLNLPYVISLCVGGILLLVSLVILVKLWLVTKHRANAVEDEKEFALDDVPMNKDNSPSFKKR